MGATQREARTDEAPDVLVVGAGLAGLGMAVSLLEAGQPDFVVLEKADGVGGIWRENTYPGCACDVASVMYSYSFAPKRDWSRMYAGQAEILDYIRTVVADHEIEPHIRFRSEAVSYEFDDAADRWVVRTADGTVYRPRVVVLAHGALHLPHVPHLPGREQFRGTVFHTAQWDHSVDLAGKRVAVVGTGSSAAQVIPEIVDDVEHLDVFQRTAHWVLPKADRRLSDSERRLFRHLPPVQWLYRQVAYWTHELPVLAFLNPRLVKVFEFAAKRMLRKEVADPALRAALTPDYEIGCKRILLSNDYLPALQKPNVELVTEQITGFTPDGVRSADGREHAVDVVVLATGFSTDNRCAEEHIVGRDGLTIQEAWRDGMTAYLGMTVSGFPNLFMIMGPNSGGGAQSILFVIEAQLHYIVRCLRLMTARGATRMEVREDVQRRFNTWLHGRLGRSVWNTGGCHSWFLDRTGHNRQSWPGTGTGYWRATRTPDPAAFTLNGPSDRRHRGSPRSHRVAATG